MSKITAREKEIIRAQATYARCAKIPTLNSALNSIHPLRKFINKFFYAIKFRKHNSAPFLKQLELGLSIRNDRGVFK